MVSIEIHVPRPLLTLTSIGVAVWMIGGWNGSSAHNDTEGGRSAATAQVVHEAEENVRDLRVQQEVLSRREEILRYQLALLEEQESTDIDDETRAFITETKRELRALLKDKAEAERQILASLQQMWDAQGYALQASHGQRNHAEQIVLAWPVEPRLGISAHFDDNGYAARFGFEHGAIDIPTDQGTTVRAPADGVVVKVSDNGYGFNSLTIRHTGGVATLYGHVTDFLVEEGQRVRAGDAIALTGGEPGTKGAGRITTGPHLHLEVYADGVKVDPLDYMEESPYLGVEHDEY